MNDYEPSVRLIKASFDPDFISRLRENIKKPEVHENGMVSEVCGSSLYDTNYTIFHDKESANKPDKNGFQRGGVEKSHGGENQFCHPKKNSTRILWHTHPRGTPAYPSGSDIFVVMVKDCSGIKGFHSTAQSYIQFLFTEYGFWIIHRKVDANNRLSPAIDITRGGRGGVKMRDIESSIDMLEEDIIRPEYFKSKKPSKKTGERIETHFTDLPFKNMVHVSFHEWEEINEFKLPMALFEAEISDICPAN